MLFAAKDRAKKRGIEFSIEESDIIIPDVCPIFRIPLFFMPHGNAKVGYVDPNTPTLDRIDNSKGYVKGNVWIISWRANRLKNDATIEELETIVVALKEKMGY